MSDIFVGEEATQLLVSLWDENAGAMSREFADERDREAVARQNFRKKILAEAESRPTRKKINPA